MYEDVGEMLAHCIGWEYILWRTAWSPLRTMHQAESRNGSERENSLEI